MAKVKKGWTSFKLRWDVSFVSNSKYFHPLNGQSLWSARPRSDPDYACKFFSYICKILRYTCILDTIIQLRFIHIYIHACVCAYMYWFICTYVHTTEREWSMDEKFEGKFNMIVKCKMVTLRNDSLSIVCLLPLLAARAHSQHSTCDVKSKLILLWVSEIKMTTTFLTNIEQVKFVITLVKKWRVRQWLWLSW